MAFELNDLPKGSKLRKAAVAAYANNEHDKVVGDGPARTPTNSQPRRVRAGRPTYRCHHCGNLSSSWAAAQRHADETAHARVDIVLEAPDGRP